MNNKVTQKKIAEAANVSVNTVSLALNGSKRISQETRDNILQVARELNYIPNRLARSLVKKRSFTVGLILTELKNPIFMDLAQQIERQLFTQGYSMILMTTEHNPQTEENALDLLISHQVDGILMFPVKGSNLEKIRTIRDAGVPIIFLSGGEHEIPTDAVYVNRINSGFKATAHLLDLGHKRIGFILGGMVGNKEKIEGYEKALKAKNVSFDSSIILSDNLSTFHHGYKAAEKLLTSSDVTAIIGSTDPIALGALRACRDRAMRVPEDIAMVGFDGADFSRYTEVPLTTVVYNVEEVAYQSTNLLQHLIDNQGKLQVLPPTKIEVATDLLISKSCGGKLKEDRTTSQ